MLKNIEDLALSTANITTLRRFVSTAYPVYITWPQSPWQWLHIPSRVWWTINPQHLSFSHQQWQSSRNEGCKSETSHSVARWPSQPRSLAVRELIYFLPLSLLGPPGGFYLQVCQIKPVEFLSFSWFSNSNLCERKLSFRRGFGCKFAFLRHIMSLSYSNLPCIVWRAMSLRMLYYCRITNKR